MQRKILVPVLNYFTQRCATTTINGSQELNIQTSSKFYPQTQY